jgi:two-component system, LytTR family, response regulator
MNLLRAIIVDDEPLARDRLRRLLTDSNAVSVIADGKQAIEVIRSLTPDLVFLDVQMPEVDGFGVLAALDPYSLPAIVFCTAYDKFAVRAFEVHAVDYLLKPFDEERLKQALARVRRSIASEKYGGEDLRMKALLEEVRPPSHLGQDRWTNRPNQARGY